MTKKKALELHARRRLMERFGIKLNPDVLVKLIQEGKGVFIRKRTNRVTIWKVEHKGETFICVYDKMRKTIITVLTTEMI